jgi:calpain-15
VILDNYFPCDKQYKKPVFSSANGPELWVLILEKAYAKIHGAYDKIEAG